MGSFFSNFGHVLGAVISPPEPQETKPASRVRVEAQTMGTGGSGSGPSSGGGTGGGGAPGGPGGGVPPLSSTFRLLVILNFVLIILLGAALIWLTVSDSGAKPSVQTLITTLTNLLTASVGTFVGLIGGKAA